MSFSIKWLFVVVAIAALFAAAFAYQTEWWSIATVSLTLVTLLAATIGLSLRLLAKPFWLPFCIVGWIYLGLAFADPALTHLPLSLPPTRLAFEIWYAANQDDPIATELLEVPEIDTYNLYTVLAGGQSAMEGVLNNLAYIVRFRDFLKSVHSLFTLIFATLAGIIASFCVRRSSKIAEH